MKADTDGDTFDDGTEHWEVPVLGAAPPVDSQSWEAWGLYSYTVPAGCNALQVQAWGAGGGHNWASGGGSPTGGGGATFAIRRPTTCGRSARRSSNW